MTIHDEFRGWIRDQYRMSRRAWHQHCRELNLTRDERRLIRGLASRELNLRLPQFVKFVALLVTIGLRQQRDIEYFVRQGATRREAEELAGNFAEKLSKMLTLPHGNTAAWHSVSRRNFFIDEQEKARTQAKRFPTERFPTEGQLLADESPDKCNPLIEAEEFESFLTGKSDEAKEVANRLQQGQTIEAIAKDMGRTEKSIEELVQREWPSSGKTSPLGKRRRN